MRYQILKEPMAILDIQMNLGEKITAESGAMIYMKGDIEIKTQMREGGIFEKDQGNSPRRRVVLCQ